MGNMILLTCACGLLIVTLWLTMFHFSSATVSQTHQTRALDAAALATASDLGKIVINDENFGYVGLFDKAPIGNAPLGPDKFALPVRGINSLLATARLDILIADLIGDETLLRLAEDECRNLLVTSKALENALQSSIQSGGSKPSDVYGNPVDAYGDAQKIYLQNGGLNLQGKSLKLEIGSCSGLSSGMTIPVASPWDSVTPQQQLNGQFVAFMDICLNVDMALSALGEAPMLVDCSDFSTNQPSYAVVNDVVKASGFENNLFSAGGAVSSVSYAIPGDVASQPLNAGSLVITFADGTIPELKSFQNLFVDSSLENAPASVGQANGGDYPGANSTMQLSNTSLPGFFPKAPSVSQCCKLAFYDWLRRGGCKVQVESMIDLMKTPLAPANGGGTPYMLVFSFNADGSLHQQFLQLEKRYCQSSDKQPTLISSSQALVSQLESWNYYDAMVIDQVRQPGNAKGGLHAGEPLLDIRLTSNPPYPDPGYTNQPNENTGAVAGTSLNIGWAGASGGWAFTKWKLPICLSTMANTITSLPAGGDLTAQTIMPQPTGTTAVTSRPTATGPALAAEISFHKIIDALPRTNLPTSK